MSSSGRGERETDRSLREESIREARTGREAGPRGENPDRIGSLTLRRQENGSRQQQKICERTCHTHRRKTGSPEDSGGQESRAESGKGLVLWSYTGSLKPGRRPQIAAVFGSWSPAARCKDLEQLLSRVTAVGSLDLCDQYIGKNNTRSYNLNDTQMSKRHSGVAWY